MLALLVGKIWRSTVPPFGLAFGVTLGGGVAGALGEWLAGRPAADASQVAFGIRIWAVAIAIGGTLTAFEHFERGLSQGALSQILREVGVLAAAYAGAQTAFWLLSGLIG